MMPGSLDPRVAIVTGAAGGIGSAIANRLAERGWRVIGVDAHAKHAPSATAEDVMWITGDVRAGETIDRTFTLAQSVGGATALVNAAGIRRYRDFAELTAPELDDHLSVNVVAPMLWMARFAQTPASSSRSIVNITSVMAHSAVPANAAYCASKAALLGLSRAAARDLSGRGITVNCVAPGPTDTEMLRAGGSSLPPHLLDNIPAGRLGMPSEIAAAVEFLLSDEARFITGASLCVDGGYLTL